MNKIDRELNILLRGSELIEAINERTKQETFAYSEDFDVEESDLNLQELLDNFLLATDEVKD